jgi:hypothetical protein
MIKFISDKAAAKIRKKDGSSPEESPLLLNKDKD